MTVETEITSIAEYLEWTRRIQQDSDQQSFITFYRGHANAAYQLIPTVYHEDNLGATFRKVEHHLFQEMLRQEPAAFMNDRTVFERLVRMQHPISCCFGKAVEI